MNVSQTMVDAVRPVLTLREAGCVNALQTSSPATPPVFHQVSGSI